MTYIKRRALSLQLFVLSTDILDARLLENQLHCLSLVEAGRREKFPHQNGGGLFTLDGENSLFVFVIITSHFNNLMQSFLLTKSLCRNI